MDNLYNSTPCPFFQSLVRGPLVVKVSDRLTAAQALRHPWVKGEAVQTTHMLQAQTKLKQFNNTRKLKLQVK